LNIPAPIAAMTSSIAAVFVPQRSVRLFILAILAVCAAGLMALPSDQTKFWIHEGVSRLDHNDTKNAEICFLIAYDHAQKSRKGERYREFCICKLAEIYEYQKDFERAEAMIKEHMAVHSKDGCINCEHQAEDRRDLSRVLVKEGKIQEANAVVDPVEAAVICSYNIDVTDQEKSRSVSDGLIYVPLLPSACRFHNTCVHDVEVEAREAFTGNLTLGPEPSDSRPESVCIITEGSASAESNVSPRLNHEVVEVVRCFDSRHNFKISEQVKHTH
jgi:hypothetical protein